MKKFDYEKARDGAPVCTSDGRPVRIVCWDADNATYPIIGLVRSHQSGMESPIQYTTEGRIDPETKLSPLTLEMDAVKHEGWANVYHSDRGYCTGGHIYATKEEAMEYRDGYNDYCASVKIEWED